MHRISLTGRQIFGLQSFIHAAEPALEVYDLIFAVLYSAITSQIAYTSTDKWVTLELCITYI